MDRKDMEILRNIYQTVTKGSSLTRETIQEMLQIKLKSRLAELQMRHLGKEEQV